MTPAARPISAATFSTGCPRVLSVDEDLGEDIAVVLLIDLSRVVELWRSLTWGFAVGPVAQLVEQGTFKPVGVTAELNRVLPGTSRSVDLRLGANPLLYRWARNPLRLVSVDCTAL